MALLDIEHIQTKDEVIQEVRKIKDDLAKVFAYDLIHHHTLFSAKW
jgi:hypothetical protein